jgi:hypothetical protein
VAGDAGIGEVRAVTAHVEPQVGIDLVNVFKARCWARARLFEEGELDLHDAVDVLQESAVDTGLVAAIGQDAVQAIMAKAFGAVEAPLEIEPYQPRQVEIEPEAEPIAARLAASTIDAFKYLIRLNDPVRLREWLARRPACERESLRELLVVE